MSLTDEQLAQVFAALAWGVTGQEVTIPPGAPRKNERGGLLDAINDLVHMADSFDYATWKGIDERLAAKGLPSLEQLQAMLARKHAKILKRGRIRDLEEYYLVQNLVSDGTSDLTDKERAALGRMADEFGRKPSRG